MKNRMVVWLQNVYKCIDFLPSWVYGWLGAVACCCCPASQEGLTLHTDSLCVRVKLLQSCLTLYDPMVCSLPGSSVHGISQARTLEWDAISFSRELPDPGIKLYPLHWQVASLPVSHQGSLIHLNPTFKASLKFFRILYSVLSDLTYPSGWPPSPRASTQSLLWSLQMVNRK